MNRFTISLDDELYAMVRAHAVGNGLSMSKAVGDLLQRRLYTPPPESPEPRVAEDSSRADSYFDPVLGIPVSRGTGRVITDEDVQRAIDDEDARHLEIMGLSPEEIERCLNS